MKYVGNIGFLSSNTEVTGGIATQPIISKRYFGEIITTSSRLQTQDKINPDVTINNSIAILLDGYLNNNLSNIVYVEFLNKKWSVSSIELRHPRVILSLGGLYNG